MREYYRKKLEKAWENAIKDAYEDGYKQGKVDGYNQGLKNGKEKRIPGNCDLCPNSPSATKT